MLRGAAFDVELPRQTEGRHAVDQTEVDGLGGAALLAAHLIERQTEHLRGGGAVNVAALGEGAQQRGIAGQVRHDAQFDLRVIGRQQHDSRAAR